MDVYRPPSAVLSEPPPLQSATRFRILPAIVGGLVIDFLGSNFTGIVIGLTAGIWVGLSGGSSHEAARILAGSPFVLGAASLVGSCITVLGGYVAARWAGARFLLHGVASGSIALVLNLPLLFLVGASTAPAWLTYTGFAIQLPLAATGGWLAARRAARLFQPLQPPPA